MSQDKPPEAPPASEGDAWTILSYLLSGLILWGGAGWLLDRWLGTTFFVLLGMLLGAGSSLYLIYVRYGRAPVPDTPDDSTHNDDVGKER